MEKNQNSSKTHCLRGHELTPDNIYVSQGKRNCKQCVKLRASAKRQTKIKLIRPKATHCIHGHEYTLENTYFFPSGKGRACRTCMTSNRTRWATDHPEKTKESARKACLKWAANNRPYARSAHLKRMYGMSDEDFSFLLQKQEGKCAICKDFMDKPAVDHNHKTKQVRELLCHRCNHGIGHFRENPMFLLQAIEYLRKHES